MNRRTFVISSAFGGLATLLPRIPFASTKTDARFVLVILRGALDGLAAVPAYGDGNYASKRGALAITAPTQKLDGMFALHPSMTHLYRRYREKELIVFHAVASPYRERSHFDGQDLLESGTVELKGARDGWLNRALAGMPASKGRTTDQIAVALAQNIPLVLRGDAAVNSWAPSRLPDTDADTLQRIADLYSTDEYFATRLQSALAADGIAGDGMAAMGGGKRDPLNGFNAVTSAAGKFLAAADGPRVAVIEVGGWDTHANQGAEQGQLANRLRSLDQGLETLRTSLGAAWTETAMLVVTEFGRTVAVNGTRGTDHGTATCAFLSGGAISGGRVIADWPGLRNGDLYQQRDLKPTLDLRSVFKGVLGAHLGVSDSMLETKVFPNSVGADALDSLIRRS
ncbi:hypothetical protein GCM10011487_10350 [Steroidobacter agaridevorans]|uniref:DUF1501 domain-containing protein n=1 Tax=Steroidobacter agaridevorans TaxID=2695856 RepID=A0A829Y7U2_9GAMM|nr:DUF1501 domain-containing protein [Steroidobacter agaridevorans]GFE79035.1 hypothetical protein GCM10011487_10350 [Steroidobacter agaridevorans]